MIRTNYKQLMNIFLATFVLFSIITITNTSTTYAAASPVGIVHYQLLVDNHPDSAKAQTAMNDAISQAKSNFDTKSVSMNEQEKQSYYQQLQQGIQIKQQDLLEAIQNKVNDAVKDVAKSKGLTIVVDAGAAVYGAQDITDDVMKKIVAK
ncbi:OmpH family outer membrane protein [Pelosinus sp. IPA-1]|uniref:OmpH family outer membrane protein n=1 Tax=Pelosinus sp. IPA-1 TaxID=3029569 RepID=UPI0024362942|nr:OmpH family outer membrane protein [Pelosinus sp. IPA-1]GMA99540.1 hypothetical protein PIPA1_23400 [Pelosinus sp. IPA-1]